MPRTKSLQNIIDQRNRIVSNLANSSSPNALQRTNRVNTAYRSYVDNIHATRQYQRDVDAFNRVGDEASVRRTYAMRVNRQYSQRTYMGLNAG